MRRILTTLIALSLIPAISYCQKKKDSRILVRTDTSGKFTEIVKAFYSEGFIVSQKDREFGVVATEELKLPGTTFTSVKFQANISDSAILFTGRIATNYSLFSGRNIQDRVFDPLQYGGMKGSDVRKSWELLDKIAKQFGKPEYLK